MSVRIRIKNRIRIRIRLQIKVRFWFINLFRLWFQYQFKEQQW
jgi:hypothetical protein